MSKACTAKHRRVPPPRVKPLRPWPHFVLPLNSPARRLREAPAWQDGRRSARCERLVRRGAPEDWNRTGEFRGQPPPQHRAAYLKQPDRVLMYARTEKDWISGSIRAAPSQDPAVLVREYGSVISASFMLHKQGKEPRPCVNYRPTVNKYTRDRPFKMEGNKHTAQWGEKEMFMWDRDFSKAFNSVATGHKLQRFLVIDIGDPPEGVMGPHLPRFLVPLALNFGYKLSPHLFHLVSHEWITECRSQPHNLKVSCYADDSCGGDRDEGKALESYVKSGELIEYFGLVNSETKGSSAEVAAGRPAVRKLLRRLGLLVSTETPNGLFIVPKDKEAAIVRMATHLLADAQHSHRHVWSTEVEQYVSTMISLMDAEAEAQFRTRNLTTDMVSAGMYTRQARGRPRKFRMVLRKRAIAELKWGTKFPDNACSKTLWQKAVRRVIATDASGAIDYSKANGHYVPPGQEKIYEKHAGWGAVLMPIGGKLLGDKQAQALLGEGAFAPERWNHTRVAHGIWNAWERKQMIALLELRALRLGVIKFRSELQNCCFLAWQDNQTVMHVVRKMYSKSPTLMIELALFRDLLKEMNSTCLIRYIESARNPSDYWSRLKFASDWTLSPAARRVITDRYGMPTIDRFAQPHDPVVPRYNCPYPYPASEGHDAFTQDWTNEFNWCCPPFALADAVVQKLIDEPGAAAIVILPDIEARWSPLLREIAHSSFRLQLRRQDIVPGPLCVAVGPEPLHNRLWSMRASLVLPRAEVPSSPLSITDLVVGSGSGAETASPSRGRGRSSSTMSSVQQTTTPALAPSSAPAPAPTTTRSARTGSSTTTRAGSTIAMCATPRSSVSRAGSSGAGATRTSTRGPRPSTTISILILGAGPSTRTRSLLSKRSTRRSSPLVPLSLNPRARSSPLRPGWDCRHRVWPCSRRWPQRLAAECSTGFSCSSSRCCSLSGPTPCGDSSLATCPSSTWDVECAPSCASAASLNGTLSSSARPTGGRCLCRRDVGRCSAGATGSSMPSGRSSDGAPSCDPSAIWPAGRLKSSPTGCASFCPRDAFGCRQVARSRPIRSALWELRLQRPPGTTPTGFGAGDCGRLHSRFLRTYRMTMGTPTTASSCSASRSELWGLRVERWKPRPPVAPQVGGPDFSCPAASLCCADARQPAGGGNLRSSEGGFGNTVIFGLQKAPLPYRFLDGITVVKQRRTAHYVVAYPTDGKTDGIRMVVRGGSASARAVVTAWWLEGSLGSCSQREAEYAMAEREAGGCDGAGRVGPGRPRTPPAIRRASDATNRIKQFAATAARPRVGLDVRPRGPYAREQPPPLLGGRTWRVSPSSRDNLNCARLRLALRYLERETSAEELMFAFRAASDRGRMLGLAPQHFVYKAALKIAQHSRVRTLCKCCQGDTWRPVGPAGWSDSASFCNLYYSK